MSKIHNDVTFPEWREEIWSMAYGDYKIKEKDDKFYVLTLSFGLSGPFESEDVAFKFTLEYGKWCDAMDAN